MVDLINIEDLELLTENFSERAGYLSLMKYKYGSLQEGKFVVKGFKFEWYISQNGFISSHIANKLLNGNAPLEKLGYNSNGHIYICSTFMDGYIADGSFNLYKPHIHGIPERAGVIELLRFLDHHEMNASYSINGTQKYAALVDFDITFYGLLEPINESFHVNKDSDKLEAVNFIVSNKALIIELLDKYIQEFEDSLNMLGVCPSNDLRSKAFDISYYNSESINNHKVFEAMNLVTELNLPADNLILGCGKIINID